MTRLITKNDLELLIELLIERKERIPLTCNSEHMKLTYQIREYAGEYKEYFGRMYRRVHHKK